MKTRCFRFKKANADICIKNTHMSKLKIKYNKRSMDLNNHPSPHYSTPTSCHICISTDPSKLLACHNPVSFFLCLGVQYKL